MAEPCLECDGDLVPGARFCHLCGAPRFAVGKTRPLAPPASAQAREEIKAVAPSGAQRLNATRLVRRVLARSQPKPRPEPRRPPLWYRALAAQPWRRPVVWIAIAVLAAVPIVLVVVNDLQGTPPEQVGVQRIVTRLAAKCFQSSQAQIETALVRIQAASGGADSLLDSAVLMDIVVRGMDLPQGDCTHVVDALSHPNRFQVLFRPHAPH